MLLANINCISINRDRLEVAIADTLITALLNGLGVDTEIVKGLNFSNKDTAISLEYDGLNLSKLWLKANVGIQQGDNAALGLGLGLGHIVLTVGKRNLAALGERNILEDEYQDLLNGGNVYLGLGAEIDVPTLDGSVKYTIPEGTQTDTEFRIRGKGIQQLGSNNKGDLIFKVRVETPRRLTEKQRELLRQFDGDDNGKQYDQRKTFIDKVKELFDK